MPNTTDLDRYCDVILKIGVNLQPGQPLVIGAAVEGFHAPIESRDFVHRLTQKAYEAGASDVEVHWFDPVIARLRKAHAAMDRLTDVPTWKTDRFLQAVERGAAFIMPYAPDPAIYQGIPAERLSASNKAESAAIHPFRKLYNQMEVSWAIASFVTPGWAKQVFPDETEPDAVEKLWKMVLQTARADLDDPVAAWTAHLNRLRERQEYMNRMQFAELRYHGPGTDLTVGLAPNHLWISGATTKNGSGIPFVPNVPTEEIFTSPDRSRTNGTVRSTLPLYAGGRLICNLAFRFTDGRITEATADLPQDELYKALGLDTDEGARAIGEAALVPQSSPIAKLRTVFYNTLFDENASCHLAFGCGFPYTIEGGTALDEAGLAARGINQSTVHVDFMIGSNELDIDGVTADGRIVPLFRRGDWAM